VEVKMSFLSDSQEIFKIEAFSVEEMLRKLKSGIADKMSKM